MQNKLLPVVITIVLLAGVLLDSCKHSVDPPSPKDSSTCDTCHTDTTKHPCDTCSVDTVHHNSNDTTSHSFIWAEYTVPNDEESSLNGTCIFDNNHIYTIGRYLWSFNGAKWVERKLNTPEGQWSGMLDNCKLYAINDSTYWMYLGGLTVQCTRRSRSAADTGIIYRLDQLQVISVTEDGSLHGAWGSSENDMFFVGEKGTILHFDGESWINYPKITHKDFISVWGTSHDNVWAAGWNQTTGESVLAHFDGSAWKEQDLRRLGDIRPGSHGLIAVWACDSATNPMTYAGGSFFYRSRDQQNWSNDSGKVGNRLSDGSYAALNIIRGNSSNDILLEGAGGFTAHWNGKTWKSFDELFHCSDISYDTYAMDFKGNTACIAGTKSSSAFIAVGKR